MVQILLEQTAKKFINLFKPTRKQKLATCLQMRTLNGSSFLQNSRHMGELWEAAVKSCKYHSKEIMGNTRFTFEEVTMVFSQIEACLNSRPLATMSTDIDPTDLQSLTPVHFLVGESLMSLPDIDITVPINRLNRWQMIQETL